MRKNLYKVVGLKIMFVKVMVLYVLEVLFYCFLKVIVIVSLYKIIERSWWGG